MSDPESRQAPLVGVVGPCFSGKSTLVAALQARGIHAREIAQEHSYAPAMWQRLTQPDVLIYLDVSAEEARRRQRTVASDSLWEKQHRRLRHAYAHADLYLDTDELTPEEILERVLRFLSEIDDVGAERS